MSTQAYNVNIKNVIYKNKWLFNRHLHFWPAGDPFGNTICVCLTSCRPDQGGVGAVGIVAVGVAPRVDEVVVSSSIHHRGFRFEVPFAGGGRRQSRRSDKTAEENCSTGGSSHSGGAGSADGVGAVIGIEAFACGLKGGDLRFGGGGGAVPANGSCGTESEACEDADDGDDSEEFDQGEGGHGAERDEGVKG